MKYCPLIFLNLGNKYSYRELLLSGLNWKPVMDRKILEGPSWEHRPTLVHFGAQLENVGPSVCQPLNWPVAQQLREQIRGWAPRGSHCKRWQAHRATVTAVRCKLRAGSGYQVGECREMLWYILGFEGWAGCGLWERESQHWRKHACFVVLGGHR